MIIRELITKLGFDSENAERSARRFDGVVSRVRAGLLAAVAAATTAATGLAFFANKTSIAGDEIAKTADKLGITTDRLQEYRFAAERAGIATGTFDMAFQRFTRRAAEAANGTGEAKDALAELGVQLKDEQGNARSSEALFADVADAMSNVDDKSKRLRLAFKLFDSEGVAMVNMLDDGSAGLDEMAKRARALGIILSEETARASEEFRDRVFDLRMVLQSLQFAIGSAVIPRLTEVATRVTDWFIANQSIISQRLDRAIDFISDAIGGFIRALSGIIEFLDPVAEAMGGWETILGAIAAAFLVLRVPMAVIAGVLIAIAEDFEKFMKGQDSVIGELIAAWNRFVVWFTTLPGRVGVWLNETLRRIKNFVRDAIKELTGIDDIFMSLGISELPPATSSGGQNNVIIDDEIPQGSGPGVTGMLLGLPDAGDPGMTGSATQNNTTVTVGDVIVNAAPGQDEAGVARAVRRELSNQIGTAQRDIGDPFGVGP